MFIFFNFILQKILNMIKYYKKNQVIQNKFKILVIQKKHHEKVRRTNGKREKDKT